MLQVIDATHEHQRAEGDLAAQRDMAKWALAMVVVSAAVYYPLAESRLAILVVANRKEVYRANGDLQRRLRSVATR